MKEKKSVAVLYHIFYEDSVEQILKEVEGLYYFQPSFFFNISSDMPNQLAVKKQLLKHFPGALICQSSNKGKDIGGKLLLLNACMQMKSKPEWFVFLHDKKSLQAFNGKSWKRDLLKILATDQVQKIDSIISAQPECGIIAADHYVLEERREKGRFMGTNGTILNQLVEQYAIHCSSTHYVAGTMFWAKASAFERFFAQHDPLKIRQTLEEGNVLDNFGGTVTHAWERLLSWVITSQGFQIKTV